MSRCEKHYIKCERCGHQEEMRKKMVGLGVYEMVPGEGWLTVEVNDRKVDLCPRCSSIYNAQFNEYMRRGMGRGEGGPLG